VLDISSSVQLAPDASAEPSILNEHGKKCSQTYHVSYY
jgi:hypothetical protein